MGGADPPGDRPTSIRPTAIRLSALRDDSIAQFCSAVQTVRRRRASRALCNNACHTHMCRHATAGLPRARLPRCFVQHVGPLFVLRGRSASPRAKQMSLGASCTAGPWQPRSRRRLRTSPHNRRPKTRLHRALITGPAPRPLPQPASIPPPRLPRTRCVPALGGGAALHGSTIVRISAFAAPQRRRAGGRPTAQGPQLATLERGPPQCSAPTGVPW